MKTIGVIGLGSIGMRHAKNLQALGQTVVGFDPTIVGEGFASMWPVSRLEDLDAVVIASPTSTHADMMFMALEAKKPFFVEKPISDGVRCGYAKMVGYNLRFHSCVKKAKEWLDAGLIGEPIWANFTCAQYNDKPAYLRDGVILNWSHEIDLALYLLGPAKVDSSFTRLTDGKDDMTIIVLNHDGGTGTTIHLDYLTRPEQRGFIIGGSRGAIRANLVTRRVRINAEGEHDLPRQLTDSYDENYVEEMQAFIDRIDGKQTIGATGAEGLAALDICLEVRKRAGL